MTFLHPCQGSVKLGVQIIHASLYPVSTTEVSERPAVEYVATCIPADDKTVCERQRRFHHRNFLKEETQALRNTVYKTPLQRISTNSRINTTSEIPTQ